MNISQREKSIVVQEHLHICFKVDQEVKLKKEFEKVNGGKPIKGYVNSIRIDRNGVWYEVIYARSKNEFPSNSIHLLDSFLEDC